MKFLVQSSSEEPASFPSIKISTTASTAIFIDAALPSTLTLPSILLNQTNLFLISNYANILALPFFTEYASSITSTIHVYATEQTIVFGRLKMIELATFINEMGLRYPVLWDGVYRPFYTLMDIESCIAKIKPLHYNQTVIFDNELSFTPLSSGYAIGASNWKIRQSGLDIIFLSSFSGVSGLIHSSILDLNGLFEESDKNSENCCVVSNGVLEKKANLDAQFESIGQVVVNTLSEKGNVIFPISPIGQIYDLIRMLSVRLKSASLNHIPIHVVSPIAKQSLHISNICGEWMRPELQANLFLPAQFGPSKPLVHGDLIEDKTLFYHDTLESVFSTFNGPYIIFVSHPSMSYGESFDLLNHLTIIPNPSFILTDPFETYENQKKFLNTHPTTKIFEIPLDYRLDTPELLAILKKANRKMSLFVPNKALRAVVKEECFGVDVFEYGGGEGGAVEVGGEGFLDGVIKRGRIRDGNEVVEGEVWFGEDSRLNFTLKEEIKKP